MQQNDEIDLFELFAELYRGKWLIISAILVSLACGGSYSVVKEKNKIEKRFRDFWSWDKTKKSQVLFMIEHVTEALPIERFIESVENGDKVFFIFRPTPPTGTSTAPKTNLILSISFVLGSLIGTACVLSLNAIRRHIETSNAG